MSNDKTFIDEAIEQYKKELEKRGVEVTDSVIDEFRKGLEESLAE